MTPSTTRFSQGEIVLTPFPFTSLKSAKRRPALVISTNWFNAGRSDRILLGVTSHIPDQIERDEILIPDGDLALAGLPRRSVIKVGKIASVQATVIARSLGRLPENTLREVLERLSEVLGLL